MTTTTTNYGWVKPDVGASDDVWGGYINTDLDGIDAIVKGVSVVANAAYPASNPSGYQTAAQVASVVIGDNRIINGDMRIDQRNGGNGGVVTNLYTCDRWFYSAAQTGKGQWQRTTTGPPSMGFPYSLAFQSTSAYASLAGDEFDFSQRVEADAVSDFAWGTAGAQAVTLSFIAISSLSGTFSGSIRNFTGSRSYPFTYSLAANTWTKCVVTIPGDTGGTWVMNGNGAAFLVAFDLGSGSTLRGPAGAWANGNLVGANGAVSVVAVNGATFNLTGVKLEIGSVATPFNRQSLAKSLADCQRYYSVGGLLFQGYAVAGSIVQSSTSFAVAMRATPTITELTTSNSNVAGMIYGSNAGNAAGGYVGVTAAGQYAVNVTFSLSAEL